MANEWQQNAKLNSACVHAVQRRTSHDQFEPDKLLHLQAMQLKASTHAVVKRPCRLHAAACSLPPLHAPFLAILSREGLLVNEAQNA